MHRTRAGLLGLLGLLAAWEAADRSGLLDPVSVPPPSTVGVRLAELFGTNGFAADVVASVLAWLLALLITVGIAVPAGLVLGSVPAVRSATGALIDLVRPVPGVALIPLSIVLLGAGPQTKIALAVFAGLWPLLFNVVYGVRAVDPLLLDTARAAHLTPLQIAVGVRLRSVLPFALTGIRLTAGIQLIVVVSTEFLVGPGYPGIGSFVFSAGQQVGDVVAVLAGTVLVGTLGYLANAALGGLANRVAHVPPTRGARTDPVSGSRLSRAAWRWGVVLGCVLLWQAATAWFADPVAPTPLRIAAAAGQRYVVEPMADLAHSGVLRDVLPSLLRLSAGWALAVVVGVGVGLVLGLVPLLGNVIEPVCGFVRAIPSTLLLPLFLVWFRIGTELEIVTIAFGSVWPILLNTVDGVRAVEPAMLDTARVFGTGRWRRIGAVVLPSALPKIFAGLRISLSLAVILMVVSELVGSSDGIGYQLVQDQSLFSYPEMWAGTVLLGLIGYLVNAALRHTENRVLAWHFGAGRD